MNIGINNLTIRDKIVYIILQGWCGKLISSIIFFYVYKSKPKTLLKNKFIPLLRNRKSCIFTKVSR